MRTLQSWDPREQPLREALCTLGNGYFATRGSFEEVHAGGPHYPGTYLAGGYNRLETEIGGRVLENEDLVNWPNWLPLTFRPEGGDWFSFDAVDLLAFTHRLDVYRGVLERNVQFRDATDREFSLSCRRIVSMADPHLAAFEWRLKSHNWVLHMLDDTRRREVVEDLGLDDEECIRWDEITHKMFVPFHEDGIISQFEGYESLQEFDWDGYRVKYGDIHRLDRILEAEGDDINVYKASKQADVLMLFYLFSAEALQELFEHMGYTWDPARIPDHIDYYMRRTSHGSTLSRVVHSWVLARANREEAWQLFKEALYSDIEDIQGDTTPEGIHLGAMAGTVDLIQRAHTGIEMRDDVLWFNPLLPYELSDVQLRVHYRGHVLSLRLTDETLRVRFDRGPTEAARIGFRDTVYDVAQGESRDFALR